MPGLVKPGQLLNCLILCFTAFGTAPVISLTDRQSPPAVSATAFVAVEHLQIR
jgi:hypothetical protein